MRAKTLYIVLLYLTVSLTWILVSDQLVLEVSEFFDMEVDTLQTGKGIFFVFATAVLLFLAIKRQHKLIYKVGEQYKSLFQSNPNPLWIYDIHSLEFLEVNEATLYVYGYTREEFKSMTIVDIRPEEDYERIRQMVKEQTDIYNTTTNWTHLTKTGKKMIVNVISHKIRFNNRDCAMAMALDITERVNQEEQLMRAFEIEKELRKELEANIILVKQSFDAKRKLTEVVDRVNNMVVITEPSGVIIWVNSAFENFTGYKLDEVVGKTCSFLHGPDTDENTQPAIMRSIGDKDFASFEILNYTKTGKEYWVELNISAIYDDENRIIRHISIQNVINERKLREQKIQQQNELLRKQSWINSHAIRKPVASILSLVGLSRDMETMDELKEIHSLIEVSSKELDLIVRDITKEINACEEYPQLEEKH